MGALRLLPASLALALMTPFAAQAAPGFTTSARITNISPREFGADFVVPGGGSPMNCPYVGAYRIVLGAANYDAIIAVLLSAAATGKPVQLWVNACDNSDGVSLFIAAFVAQ